MKKIKLLFYVFIVFGLLSFYNKTSTFFFDEKNDFVKSENKNQAGNHKSAHNEGLYREPAFVREDFSNTNNDKMVLGKDILKENILSKYLFLNDGELKDQVSYNDLNSNYAQEVYIFKTSFKYPYIRVVEEIDKTTNEIFTSVMVADHILVKLHEGFKIDSIKKDISELGARVREKMRYSKIYYIEFDISNLEQGDNFIKVSEALKSRDDILISNPDRIFTIY